MAKSRKYLESYLKLGFTSMLDHGNEKPQCVLCHVVLSNDAMKPSKLKRHLQQKHPEHEGKDLSFYQRQKMSLKRQKLDASGYFQQQSTASLEASFEVALQIAKQKKPHTIAETIVKPCAVKMVKLILGEKSSKKIEQVCLSNDTIKRRISVMSTDVKQQVIDELKASPMFSIQLDESTDVASCSQLLVFVRYIHMEDVKEEFLLCNALETTAKAQDVMDTISKFFETEGIQWEKLCGVCTDGAPAMLGSKSGFQMKVKEKSPQVKGVHCMIHRYALACKTLPSYLKNVLDSVVKMVNFIKKSPTTSRLFKQLCKEMNSDHETLLFYTAVRWLSKGNVVSRFYELSTEIKLFLEMVKKDNFNNFFSDETWLQGLAYLADITEQLNKFNLRLQGPDTNILQFKDVLFGFVEKVQNWDRKINQGNFAMFEKLSAFEATGLRPQIKQEISEHLQSLEKEFQNYFPDLTKEVEVFPRNPFSPMIDIATVSEELQDELLDLRNDSASREMFLEKSLTQFWCIMLRSYPKVSKEALRVIVPFALTYLCESGFSALVHIKSKARNQLNVEDDMRLSISKTKPRISRLVSNMQQQNSH
ncbi:zinc finger BED domain-containing protein 5-like [Clavelina lepadiformis]|uniref:zinc finger BED domain-containing protein 5-like n=1 Tax=Clavelina lepadiformis TaxID=159417 RepID=UPI0040431A58